MIITVVLYAILREKLSPESKGKADLTFPEGATIQDVVEYLELPQAVIVAVNEEIVRDPGHVLYEGDTLQFLRPSKGGCPKEAK